MIIKSTFGDDVRSAKRGRGAYEWWYFDAVSNDGSVQLVIIFYEGNPFSRRYIQQLQNGSPPPRAEGFPAISISLYKNQRPIYYSFTEVDKGNASFSEDHPLLKVADHSMQGKTENNIIVYDLELKETLPSGDAISGQLRFESPVIAYNLFETDQDQVNDHYWNLVQPRAQVTGTLRCSFKNESPEIIHFEGQGYHDHNTGNEPLKNQFEEWYWGRFHFEDATLVYYLMGEGQRNQCGWLISPDNRKIISTLDEAALKDSGISLYGLTSSRKVVLRNSHFEVMVQQTDLLDNGPFYQRFSSDAFLRQKGSSRIQKSSGITEYLRPPRIYNRLYWPLTNMRIRYEKESPHWVQRSKTLYRWTW